MSKSIKLNKNYAWLVLALLLIIIGGFIYYFLSSIRESDQTRKTDKQQLESIVASLKFDKKIQNIGQSYTPIRTTNYAGSESCLFSIFGWWNKDSTMKVTYTTNETPRGKVYDVFVRELGLDPKDHQNIYNHGFSNISSPKYPGEYTLNIKPENYSS